MALPAPAVPLTSQWGTLKIEIPDFLKSIRDGINSIAEIIITFLDIGLTVLRFVKSFLLAFLNPIKAIIDAILDTIRKFIDDLRKLGVYLTSDGPLLKRPFDDLKGGFAEYERRMIGRLTDRTDPTRPDVSGSTQTLAIFFYLSVDISEIERLISTIRQILAFFDQGLVIEGGPPVPVLTGAKYGFAANTGFSGALTSLQQAFEQGTPPDLAEVTWKLAPTTAVSPYSPIPPIPPGGFIVTVSTLPEGLHLVYDRADQNAGMVDSQAHPSKKVQPREHKPVLDLNGQPAILHGGSDGVYLSKRFAYNPSFAGGVIKPGFTRVYGLRSLTDETVIPLELLTSGGTQFLQKTFWIDSSLGTALDWMAGGYTFKLQHDQLPHAAEFVKGSSDATVSVIDRGLASTYYVRIASCSAQTAEAREFRYDFIAAQGLRDANQPFKVPLIGGDISSVSAFSEPFKVVFPSVDSQEYLKALETALAVLLLSRSDLPTIDDLNIPQPQKDLALNGELMLPGVARTKSSLEGLRHLIKVMYPDLDADSKSRGKSPLAFRSDLRNRIKRLAQDIYERTGPMPDEEARVVQETEYLRNVTWSDLLGSAGEATLTQWFAPMTILESLDDSLDGAETKAGAREYGVAINPYCASLTPDTVEQLLYVKDTIRGRSPFIQVVLGGPDPDLSLVDHATPAEAALLLQKGPYSQRSFYQKFVQADGSIQVGADEFTYLKNAFGVLRLEGSGDLTPVFFAGLGPMEQAAKGGPTSLSTRATFSSGMVFIRDIFDKSDQNQLYEQTALVLGIAASATKNFGPGQWQSFRFFDSFPGIDGIFDVLLRWLEGIDAALKGVVDQILKYIDFIESRIIELQQFIRRINALLQSILNFSFQIPAVSALMLLSNGTGGVLGDLVTAQDKPSDSPLAYGAGLALVMPLFPGIPIDFLLALLSSKEGPPTGTMSTQSSETLFGIEGLPAPAAPSDEPEVL